MPDGELTDEELAALLGESEDDVVFGELPISGTPPAAKNKTEAPKPASEAKVVPSEEKPMSQADIDALLASLASQD